MLGTSMQFGRGEDRFFPARPRRSHGHQHRSLQRSKSGCSAKGATSGGATSSSAAVTTGKFAVLDDREPENSKPAGASISPVVRAEVSGCSGNLDRFLESTTPTVPAQYLPKTTMRGWRTCDVEYRPFFVLGDLWESFKEWSAYGAGVPLVMNDTDCVMQYYVPYLSGIQLYGEPRRKPANLRLPGVENDSDCSRDSTSDGSSDGETDRSMKFSWQDRVSLRKTRVDSQEGSSSDDRESDSPQGLLLFEFLERNLPYCREPLADKISYLTCRFPGLKTLRSCDLLPCSWVSVAWYPIYRIPTGPTLRDLDACFLTFHSLSTPIIDSSRRAGSANDLAVSYPNGTDGVPRISLPTFGLASYKLKGSTWSSDGGSGGGLADSLLQAADSWLRRLHVAHPDYQFFASHGAYRR